MRPHLSGKLYELQIHRVLRQTFFQGKIFHSQTEQELGGCSSRNDLLCNVKETKDCGIEIKKCKTPDWMQCSLFFEKETKAWNVKGDQPHHKLFQQLIQNINLFEGQIPPFVEKKITHEQWKNVKKENPIWRDIYIDIPDDTISRLYSARGCNYIQISEYGLFHLNEDSCSFGVPFFRVEQQLRIRTKVHRRSNKKGFCDLSVMVACKPKNIKSLTPSPFSLDKIKSLPPVLTYNHNL